MPRGKATKKSSMRGKRGVDGGRTMMRGRDADKKVAGEVTPRATSRARVAVPEKVAVRAGRMAKVSKVGKGGKGGKAKKVKSRPRKSDI